MAEPTIDVRILEGPVGPAAADPPDAAGAECVFLGRTRPEVHPEHGCLECLRYEAYEPLARRVLAELAGRAAERHGCRSVRIHHATGPVAVGEASVLVQVFAGHRAEAFAACRELIDAVKASAPIWKREVWSDGATWATGTPVAAPETVP